MRDYFIKSNLDRNPNADKTVLEFISNFLTSNVWHPDHYTGKEEVFRNGYCWYFAHMLQLAFECGEVCWCAPYAHFVWMKDGIAYDVDGVNEYLSNYHIIPEEYAKEIIDDFKHIPGRKDIINGSLVNKIVHRYSVDKEDNEEE